MKNNRERSMKQVTHWLFENTKIDKTPGTVAKSSEWGERKGTTNYLLEVKQDNITDGRH